MNEETINTLRADISQHCAMKMAFEQIFGTQAWLDLKECTSIAIWKKYITMLLCAMQLAIEETIQVRDDDWFTEVRKHFEDGLQITKTAKLIDELFSDLSATLMRIVFLQIGNVPNRRRDRRVTLARDNWRLDGIRTVQYIQSNSQLEHLFWTKQQNDIGFDNQMRLRGQYRASRSKLTFSKWCIEQHETVERLRKEYEADRVKNSHEPISPTRQQKVITVTLKPDGTIKLLKTRKHQSDLRKSPAVRRRLKRNRS